MSPGIRRDDAGFSLIEMVVTISVSAVLAALTTGFITGPVDAYNDVAERARLVGAAEAALQRTAREIRRALPNSLRVSGTAIEIYHLADGVRYRDAAGSNEDSGETLHPTPDDTLELTGDSQFNVFGELRALSFSYGTPLAGGHRVAVYPHDGPTLWADAATGADPGLVTPSGTTVTIADDGDEDQIQLSASHTFPFASPANRLFIVDTPISFVCDPVAGRLTRYAGYAPTSGQPTNPLAAPLSGASAAIVTTDVSGCAFSYTPGTAARAGLITLSLTLSRGGETVRLLHQVHVVNTP